jgi:tRNA pseudouridine38-40 synthase
MRNIKLTIAYDGTDYHGWQIQPGLPTIQGALTGALRQITPRDPIELATLYGAGRTDAGVHAWGQVASFKTNSNLTPTDFTRALNAQLTPAIRIRQAEEAAPDFHARYSAQAKTYRYRIYRGQVVPPFLWRYILHHPQPLNFAAMSEAARHFEGEHDFETFAASTGNEEDNRDRTTRRTILTSQIIKVPAEREAQPTREADVLNASNFSSAANSAFALRDDASLNSGETHGDEEWVYIVRGRSFMRNMVRKMVGTLLEVGRGRLTPEDILRLLAQANRTDSGPTAQPHGLYLHSVEYPDATDSSSDAAIGAARSLTRDRDAVGRITPIND